MSEWFLSDEEVDDLLSSSPLLYPDAEVVTTDSNIGEFVR